MNAKELNAHLLSDVLEETLQHLYWLRNRYVVNTGYYLHCPICIRCHECPWVMVDNDRCINYLERNFPQYATPTTIDWLSVRQDPKWIELAIKRIDRWIKLYKAALEVKRNAYK